MNNLVLMSASSGLGDIVSFFNNYATSGDVDGALVSTAFIFKAVLWLIIFVGAVAMAIWLVRIAVDILLLVTRGTKIAESGLKNFGTGKDGGAADVKDYISKNFVEIILVIVLITFLITGWLFRLIAIALSGFGALGNKLFDLDLEASFTTTEVTSYLEQLSARRAVSLKAEYDELLGNARNEVSRLYGYAKEGRLDTDAAYEKSKKLYTHYMHRAEAINVIMTGAKINGLNVSSVYFKQHLSTKGAEVCNANFFEHSTKSLYKNQITCGDVKPTKDTVSPQ